MKKIALLAVIVLGVLALVSQNAQGAEEKTLRVLAGVSGGKTPEENELFAKELSKRMGVKVIFDKPAGVNLLTVLSSKESYDVVMISNAGDLQLVQEQGALLDLTSFVKSSPLLSNKAIIPQSEWDLIKTEDGKIFASFNKKEGAQVPTVRKDWMKALGLKNPTTLGEYTQVFEAFKKKYNAYGIAFAQNDNEGLINLQPFMGTLDLKMGYVMVNGKRTIPYASDEAATVYNWLGDLNKKGLIEPNYATNTTADMRNSFLSDKSGMVVYWDAWVGLFNNLRMGKKAGDKFEAGALNAPKDKAGKELYMRGTPSLWAIPTKSKNPELAKRFLEFWISQEGNIMSTIGIEGHDYNVVNGKYVLTAVGKEHAGDHGAPFVQNAQYKNPNGFLPNVEQAKTMIFNNPNAIPVLPKYSADWKEAQTIINKYTYLAIKGTITGEEAVKSMKKDLKSQDLID